MWRVSNVCWYLSMSCIVLDENQYTMMITYYMLSRMILRECCDEERRWQKEYKIRFWKNVVYSIYVIKRTNNVCVNGIDIECEDRQDKLKYRDSKSLLFILRWSVNNKKLLSNKSKIQKENEHAQCVAAMIEWCKLYTWAVLSFLVSDMTVTRVVTAAINEEGMSENNKHRNLSQDLCCVFTTSLPLIQEKCVLMMMKYIL